MGSIQDIKNAFMELSLSDREKLISELLDTVHKPKAEKEVYTPTEKQQALGITAEMIAKHPALKLAGIWSEEEGNRIIAAIEASDYIDEDGEGCFGH